MNKIKTWVQGRFIDGHKYSHWSAQDKKHKQKEEIHLVRPSHKGSVICYCPNPEDAKWIAERLNLAAELEEILNGVDLSTYRSNSALNMDDDIGRVHIDMPIIEAKKLINKLRAK